MEELDGGVDGQAEGVIEPMHQGPRFVLADLDGGKVLTANVARLDQVGVDEGQVYGEIVPIPGVIGQAGEVKGQEGACSSTAHQDNVDLPGCTGFDAVAFLDLHLYDSQLIST